MDSFYAFVVLPLAAAIGYLIACYRQTKFDAKSVRGKRVMITGGSQGLGREIAYEYSKLGARVLVTARRVKELEEVVAKCKELGAEQAEYLAVDLAKPEDRARVFVETEAILGGLDHLILNHIKYGIGAWTGSEQNQIDIETDVNVNVIATAQLALKSVELLQKNRGSIGYVSSTDAIFPYRNGGTHSVTKSALHGFFNTMYLDFQQSRNDISVTECILGAIATVYDRKSITYFGMQAAAADETARAIIEAVTSRVRVMHHPFSTTVALFLYRFLPTWVESYTSDSHDYLIKMYADIDKKK